MTLLDAEVILRLSENGLVVSETARKMFMHRNTVMYHIRKIRRETGKDPCDFYDMCYLLPKAKAVYAKKYKWEDSGSC